MFLQKQLAAAALAFTSLLPLRALAVEGTLLAPANEIDHRCVESLRADGIYCQRDGDPAPAINPNAVGVPLDREDHLPFDPTNMRVVAILHLTPVTTPQGFSYYTATLERFKSNLFNTSFSPTDRFENSIWRFLSNGGIQNSNVGSPAEQSYLQQQDEILQSKHAAEEAQQQRQHQIQAQQAYEASPDGRKAAAQKAVAGCRATIDRAHRAIAQDERVAQISGYENKLLREQAAMAIVNCQDTIARGGYPPAQ